MSAAGVTGKPENYFDITMEIDQDWKDRVTEIWLDVKSCLRENEIKEIEPDVEAFIVSGGLDGEPPSDEYLPCGTTLVVKTKSGEQLDILAAFENIFKTAECDRI